MIKINTLDRTMEDEKSKASALKANELKLNAQIESLNTKIENLMHDNTKLDDEKQNLQEACQQSDSKYR